MTHVQWPKSVTKNTWPILTISRSISQHTGNWKLNVIVTHFAKTTFCGILACVFRLRNMHKYNHQSEQKREDPSVTYGTHLGSITNSIYQIDINIRITISPRGRDWSKQLANRMAEQHLKEVPTPKNRSN